MTPVARTVSLCLIFISLVVAMLVYSTLRTPTLSDEELRAQGVFLLPRPRELADFELTDHFGRVFDKQSLLDKWTLMFFGFTHCPDVCPTTMSEMGKAHAAIAQLDEAAGNFQGVLVTVDPERDTAELLGPYVTAFSPDFVGVLGDIEETSKFALQLHAAFAKVPDGRGSYSMDHTGTIVIINPHGHYHGFIKLPHKAQTIRLAYQSLAAGF